MALDTSLNVHKSNRGHVKRGEMSTSFSCGSAARSIAALFGFPGGGGGGEGEMLSALFCKGHF